MVTALDMNGEVEIDGATALSGAFECNRAAICDSAGE